MNNLNLLLKKRYSNKIIKLILFFIVQCTFIIMKFKFINLLNI